jgi:hypothetical protein
MELFSVSSNLESNWDTSSYVHSLSRCSSRAIYVVGGKLCDVDLSFFGCTMGLLRPPCAGGLCGDRRLRVVDEPPRPRCCHGEISVHSCGRSSVRLYVYRAVSSSGTGTDAKPKGLLKTIAFAVERYHDILRPLPGYTSKAVGAQTPPEHPLLPCAHMPTVSNGRKS